ncbi:MAG: hypothetical protein IJ721_03070 [Bacteroidales bacterium]|nr:hypothetical protein [Bacteroidales bacterium]
MKRTAWTLAALLLLSLTLSAQTTHEDFVRRYNNLTGRVGPAGVGVETLLDRWEAAEPDDFDMLLARFSFCFTKCQTSHVVQLDRDRYLGREPLLPFTDSTGVKRNYFEDTDYDDETFGEAQRYLDRAIGLAPDRLDFRLLKVTALAAYEKESPDMALSALKALADEHYTTHPAWQYDGLAEVDEDTFKALMQDYCFAFFRNGSAASAEAFKSLSEHLLKYNKDEPMYLDNIGSYYLVHKKDSKKALKYYNKVLKAHPDDVTAIRNCLLLARNAKDAKLEKKYLPLMVRYGETETDRASAQARLDALERKR